MNPLKMKKAPIVLPLILLALALGGYTLTRMQGATAANSLTLGQQYLNELNYGGAVAAFTRTIELDPGNTQARVGLAQAYAGTGNYDFAQQVLDQMVYTQRPDEEAAATMVQLLRDSGQLASAAVLTQTLINATDKEDYYALREELLAQLYARPRSLAVGTDQTLSLQEGQVLSRGSNTLGQLGLDPEAVPTMERFTSARFNGQAAKVACVGRTSFVVDRDGALWAAGENRWGQRGEGSATTAPQSGWTQISCHGPVVDVAGTTGRLLVLLADGSVWTAGAGSDQTLRQLTRFSAVVGIAASRTRAAVLTTGGVLYCSGSDAPERWDMVARDVRSFTLSNNALCWVGEGGTLCSDDVSFSVPSSWWQEDGARPDHAVVSLANNGSITLFTGAGGALYQLPGDGTVKEVSCPAPVVALYAQGDVLVLEYEDGSVQCWERGDTAPKPVTGL